MVILRDHDHLEGFLNIILFSVDLFDKKLHKNYCVWFWYMYQNNMNSQMNRRCNNDTNSDKAYYLLVVYELRSSNTGIRSPCNPYKPCNHNLYIAIIIFTHIDNTQSTCYNKLKKKHTTTKQWGHPLSWQILGEKDYPFTWGIFNHLALNKKAPPPAAIISYPKKYVFQQINHKPNKMLVAEKNVRQKRGHY